MSAPSTTTAPVVVRSPRPDNAIGRTILVRDALGRAHYERMAAGFARGGMPLPGWDDLSERSRESYRQQLDYVLPLVFEALDADHLLSGGAR